MTFACTGNKFNDKAVEPIAELIKVTRIQGLIDPIKFKPACCKVI